MVETGESRTLPTRLRTISKDNSYSYTPYTINHLQNSLGKACDPTVSETDPIKLIPLLLDQLIALGNTAKQLRQAFDRNSHPLEQEDVSFQYLENEKE